MAKKLKRKTPPSRIKYENSHPTVSCRVSKEIYGKMAKSKEVDGKSFADILKIGLGIAEKDDEKLVEAKQKSYDEGYDEGHRDGLEECASTQK